MVFDGLVWITATSTKGCDCSTQTSVVPTASYNCFVGNTSAPETDNERFTRNYAVLLMELDGCSWVTLTSTTARDRFAQAPAASTTDFDYFAEITQTGPSDGDYLTKIPAVVKLVNDCLALPSSASIKDSKCIAQTRTVSLSHSDYFARTFLASKMDRACFTRASAVPSRDFDRFIRQNSASMMERYCSKQSTLVLRKDLTCSLPIILTSMRSSSRDAEPVSVSMIRIGLGSSARTTPVLMTVTDCLGQVTSESTLDPGPPLPSSAYKVEVNVKRDILTGGDVLSASPLGILSNESAPTKSTATLSGISEFLFVGPDPSAFRSAGNVSTRLTPATRKLYGPDCRTPTQ